MGSHLKAEHRSTCLKQLQDLTNIKSLGVSHHDLEPSCIRKDELAVQLLVDLMETEWINPFSGDPTELISLSTASVAPSYIAIDLLTANVRGERAYQNFQDERIRPGKKPFHDPLPKQKLKTFPDINTPRVAKSTYKDTVLKADHMLFGHMALIAGSWT